VEESENIMQARGKTLEFLEIFQKFKKINSSRKELQSIIFITQAYNFSIVFAPPSMQNFI
jgi:hypothetical protein